VSAALVVAGPLVTGVGVVSPFGCGRAALVEAWRLERRADRVADGPEAGAVRVPDFAIRDRFPEQRPLVRRMDRLSRLICMGTGLAVDDAGGLGDGDGDGTALAVGTDLGTLEETWRFLERLREKGPAFANPADFPNLVPNAGAGYAGIFLGLRGPSQTFCQHETCGDEAVGWAADGIAAGWFDRALAGGAEELGAVRARASAAARCLPPGDVAGEGACFVVLESLGRARARGARPLARVLGSWGGSHAPGRSPFLRDEPDDVREAAAHLLRRALGSARLDPARVGVVLLSQPSDPGLREAVAAALGGRSPPLADHAERVGSHPADGGFRIGLASLLLADRSLPVHLGGVARDGDAALVLSAARGGSLRVTLLVEAGPETT
jgi:3-oxoacyl-[acyl-carrier-protein] synthase II